MHKEGALPAAGVACHLEISEEEEDKGGEERRGDEGPMGVFQGGCLLPFPGRAGFIHA